jgi:Ca2+-transporting ATPase
MCFFQRDSDVHVHWKGAAEIVLALCTNWLDVDGSIHEMTPDKANHLEHFLRFNYLVPCLTLVFQANQFKEYIEDMAEQSLRCVAFAYRNLDPKDIPSEEQRINWQLPDNDLTLIGIVGMKVHGRNVQI